MLDKLGAVMSVLLFIGIISMSLYFSGVLSRSSENIFFYIGIFSLGASLGYMLANKIVK